MKKQTRQFIKGNFPGLTYQKRNFLRGNFLIPKLFLSLKENFIDCRLLKTCTKSTANNCPFKANNKSTRTSCELCSKLTTKTSGQCHCSRSDVFIFNFEHFSYLELMFLLLTLRKFWFAGRCSIFSR